jgi:hypothetical protein
MMNLTSELGSIHGEASGVSRLRLILRIRNREGVSVRPVSVVAEVSAGRSRERQDSAFVGGANVRVGGEISPGREDTWVVSIPLTPHQLHRIEQVRRSGDLYFFLDLHYVAVAISAPGDSYKEWTIDGDVQDHGCSDCHTTVKVARSDWTTILKQLGYSDQFLIEVPLASVPRRAGMQGALNHLSAAWDHFYAGNDEETLVSCYKAFEHLAKAAGCKHPDQNGFDRLLAGADAAKRNELKLVLARLCDFFHLARHESDGTRAPIDRRDAELGLIMTQAGLGYLAKTMGRPESNTKKRLSRPPSAAAFHDVD